MGSYGGRACQAQALAAPAGTRECLGHGSLKQRKHPLGSEVHIQALAGPAPLMARPEEPA